MSILRPLKTETIPVSYEDYFILEPNSPLMAITAEFTCIAFKVWEYLSVKQQKIWLRFLSISKW